MADRVSLYRRRLRRLARLSLHPTRIPRKVRVRRRGQERQRLLSLLPARAECAEVGTWRGDFAAAILASRRPARLYLIDPWEYRTDPGYDQASYGGHSEDGQARLDAMHASVLERFDAQIRSGQVLVRRARSLEAAAGFADESLDWVYIDADHSYEGVSGDLEAFFRVVRPGGFLAGDDYGHEGSWFEDGVRRAVDEFAPRCAALTVIGTQFVLQKH